MPSCSQSLRRITSKSHNLIRMVCSGWAPYDTECTRSAAMFDSMRHAAAIVVIARRASLSGFVLRNMLFAMICISLSILALSLRIEYSRCLNTTSNLDENLCPIPGLNRRQQQTPAAITSGFPDECHSVGASQAIACLHSVKQVASCIAQLCK